jgi:hypothetical protein
LQGAVGCYTDDEIFLKVLQDTLREHGVKDEVIEASFKDAFSMFGTSRLLQAQQLGPVTAQLAEALPPVMEAVPQLRLEFRHECRCVHY